MRTGKRYAARVSVLGVGESPPRVWAGWSVALVSCSASLCFEVGLGFVAWNADGLTVGGVVLGSVFGYWDDVVCLYAHP